jgi:hypothetical protein
MSVIKLTKIAGCNKINCMIHRHNIQQRMKRKEQLDAEVLMSVLLSRHLSKYAEICVCKGISDFLNK